MLALYLTDSTVQLRTTHPVPIPGDDDVLIQVHLAGLCQTDLEIARGYMHFSGILGHEFVGTVVSAGKNVDAAWIGRRVCAEINCVCQTCALCMRGLETHCLQRTVIGILNHDGAFAEFLRAPARNLHAVPDSVSDEEAVFVEPLAAAFQILQQIAIDKTMRITVLGDGRLGQLVAQVLALTSCTLTLVGRHPEKLAIAQQLARGRLNTILERDLISGRDQDVVVDCTGRASGLSRAMQLLRPRGTLVLKTTVADPTPLHLAPIVIDEFTLIGSRCGPFPEAIRALAAREVDVLTLISRRVSLADAAALFTAPPSGLKTLITIAPRR